MSAGTRTLSEIRATCTKAARGAGCPWGLAEEAGLAARVLESHGLPWVRVLARLFETRRDCLPGAADAPRCGIRAMAALSDRLDRDGAGLPEGPVAAPLMLAAPLLLAARSEGLSGTLTWPGAAIRFGPDGVVASGVLDAPEADRVTLRIGRTAGGAMQGGDWRGRAVDARDWAALERLAARMLVPESEGSRRGGAGPGEEAGD